MMKSILALFFSITLVTLTAQMNPEEVVQKQLDNYNTRDIDGFMSLIDQEITVYEFSNGVILLKGFSDFRNYYAELFGKSPELHSKILNRTVLGAKVIDHEYITGRNGSATPTELILIYEVKNDKIYKITVIRNQT